jgi:sulfonate transport system ATP-binding protein
MNIQTSMAGGHSLAEPEPLAVDIRGLSRSFDGRSILGGIDLAIRPGEFVALLGRSGSGKSTLLRVLCGFDQDAEGRITVARRRSIVFQEPRLQPWLRVADNVGLGLPRKEAARTVAPALAEVGLTGRERDWPITLSGGEAQRVGLARALVREPDLLMLDEPFGALDALTRLRMHGLLRTLYRKHRPAVLLVTHDVDEAITLASRILVLRDGAISLDLQNDVAAASSRADPAFERLRSTLLEELGVKS